ncbi:MAG: molybdenum cofactor biosynthesis protein MoaE [Aestuariivita sp.]|nr:molybdenum cofactor biosynthesis protein MoaE [Aestuariivita sp.]
MQVRVQKEAFDFGNETNTFAMAQSDMGAIVTFSGIVRNLAETKMSYMNVEHYPGMAEKTINKIVDDAANRWSLGDVLVIHRYGRLAPGDLIMMVATASKHRKNAFESASYLMDYLKSRAPFWKKEVTDQSQDWVVSKTEDETALKRW